MKYLFISKILWLLGPEYGVRRLGDHAIPHPLSHRVHSIFSAYGSRATDRREQQGYAERQPAEQLHGKFRKLILL